jgi:acyl-CoA hydrolase
MDNSTEVLQHRVVLREYLNDQGNLFGGNALKWMDEVAYITASRLTRQKMVTVSADKIRFLEPVKEGSMLKLTGHVVSAGIVRSVIKVELWLDGNLPSESLLAVEGQFTLVAVDNDGKATRRLF